VPIGRRFALRPTRLRLVYTIRIMPEEVENRSGLTGPSDRIQNHRREAQALLQQGGEQPQYEYKRSVNLGRENLDDRLDFVKLVQAVANAEASGDRCIVVGGDPKGKKFYPVTNAVDFDPANLSKILGLYLDPLPLFLSCQVTTDDDIPFVLIVLEANQPRPIVVIKQGQTEQGKNRLEVGDVWIKKNTDTVKATRADIDRMYKMKSEEEAEDRARKRVNHILELLPSTQLQRTSTALLPSRELIFGPKTDLRAFAAEIAALDDQRRFKMLLELCRETLVEGWENTEIPTGELVQFFAQLDDFYTNQFLPTLDSVVELGLTEIKFNGSIDSLGLVVELLVEGFETCRLLAKFQIYRGATDAKFPNGWWRPGFDIYCGIRTLAVYTVVRRRLPFLRSILPRVVTRSSANQTSREVKTPMVLWPFSGLGLNFGGINASRAEYFWKYRIGAAWGNYFGNQQKFIIATEQLELLLEFNSHFGTNQVQDPALAQSLAEGHGGQIAFEYGPDLYSRDLGTTLPMAETLYDALASDHGLPDYLELDPRLRAFVNKHLKPQRLELYGRFLNGLKVWQSEARRGSGAWGFMWDWPGRLKAIVDADREKQKAKSVPQR
jgi:hypothetical protein